MLFSDAAGKISDRAPKLSFLDHGFLFGDSIYEVVRLYDGKLFGWQEHLDRLQASASRIRLDLSKILPDLKERVQKLFKAGGKKNAVVRIVISRGEGELHIDPRSCSQPEVYMAHWEFYRDQVPASIRVLIPQVRRNAKDALDPAIKSGNYLNNIMAFQEASSQAYDDAVMLNPEGQVSEMTTSNIGWVVNGKIETPSTEVGILHGVTRKHFLEACRVQVVSYGPERLEKASEVFALSTLKEVLPIREIKISENNIKSFGSFEETLKLQKKFRAYIQGMLQKEEVVV